VQGLIIANTRVDPADAANAARRGLTLRRWWLSSASTAVILAVVGHAHAQQATPAPAAQTQAQTQTKIEEVVVTAQKRAQRAQNVPITISTFSSAQLEQRAISSVTELNQIAPGIGVTQSTDAILLPYLRGIGNSATSPGNEASNAVYVDDVYISRLDSSVLALNNIQRIEVLEGPQGTLFGRNSTGGLINIATRTPTQTPTVDASFSYGNYNTSTENIYVAGGLAPGIAADLAFYNSDQLDGWGKNVYNGHPMYTSRDISLRSKWVFNLSDTTTLRLIGDYSRNASSDGIQALIYPGTAFGTDHFLTQPPYNLPFQKFPGVGFYNVDDNLDQNNISESWGVSARLDQDLGFARLSSITSYRSATDYSAYDGDESPLNEADYALRSRYHTTTEEVQFASTQPSTVDYILGFFYLHDTGGYLPFTYTGEEVGPVALGGALGPLPATTGLNIYGQEVTNDFAGYAQATYHVLPDTNITGGIRYTWDYLTANGTTNLQIPGAPLITLVPETVKKATFTKPTFKVSVDHHFTPDLMAYATFSTGFKAGTFNTGPLSAVPARPETVKAYEIGLKSQLFDNRLQSNASLFYYDVGNPQVENVINGVINLTNAKAAIVRGFEIDEQYLVTDGLRLLGGGEYLNNQYASYGGGPLYTINNKPPYGSFVTSGDLDGYTLVRSPTLTAYAGFNYTYIGDIGRFDLYANYSYNSGFSFTPDDVVRQGPFSLLNATLTYRLPGNKPWEFQLWGKNITGTEYYSSGTEEAGRGFIVGPAPPATFGFTLRYKM
jgi:iron complex outermembrane receptor protein